MFKCDKIYLEHTFGNVPNVKVMAQITGLWVVGQFFSNVFLDLSVPVSYEDIQWEVMVVEEKLHHSPQSLQFTGVAGGYFIALKMLVKETSVCFHYKML